MKRPQARDGLPQPQRLRAMLVVLTGLSMSVLDGAIANIALPTIATIRFIHPSDQLGRGIGINALVASISAALGPSVASGILSIGSWQWLFAINVPLGVAALALSTHALPQTPLAHHRFDWLSALLSAVTFGALISGIDNLRRFSVGVVLEPASAAVAGALFVWRQRLLAYPMLAFELFARPVFTLAVVTSICSFTAQNLALSRCRSSSRRCSADRRSRPGCLMTPWPVAVGFAAPVAGWLAARNYPAGTLGGIGLAILSLGLVLVASQETHTAVSRIAWCMVICGAGFGFFQSPNNRTILATAPRARAGGVLATARLVGQTLGAALVGLIFALTSASPRGIGHGATLSLLVGAGFATAGAVASSLRLFSSRQAEPPPSH
jgi:MFS transporter, DHA2 family, multidrug resistance protein